ncbi:MAG: SBBP repeat-containing protein [Methanobacteriota archaeon]
MHKKRFYLFKHTITATLPLLFIINLTLTLLITPPLQSIDNTPIPLNIIQVKTQWVTRYNGDGNNLDQATAIALDNQGNTYVTGFSRGPPGEEQLGNYDIVTIKYNKTGAQQWVRRWDNPIYHLDDFASAIAVDTNGNVYITGKSLIGTAEYTIVILKYNSQGIQQWEDFYYGGISQVLDYPEKIVLDGNGNVYVSGSVRAENNQFNVCVLKYTGSGEQLWVRCYDGEAHSNDTAQNIAVKNNEIVVVGETATFDIYTDYLIIKYNTDGDLIWVDTYDEAGTNDAAYAIAIDESENIYVTGASNNGEVWYAYDYATLKYSSDGDLLWVQRYDALANETAWASTDYAYDILLTPEGHVVVAGKCTQISGLLDYYSTVSYTTEGELGWVNRYYVYRGCPPSLAQDAQGNIYLCGSCAGGSTYHDYLTIRYSPTGDIMWVQTYNGPGNYWDKAADIVVDNQANVYVTGFSTGQGSDYDYATITYSQQGLPNMPSAPYPYDGAIHIPVTTQLSWTGGDPDPGDSVTYDVYFGTTNLPPKLVSNQTTTTYNPGSLDLDVTYYWQIISWDQTHQSTPGPLWMFTTGESDSIAPQLEIIKPRLGCVYYNDHEALHRFSERPAVIIGTITITVNAIDSGVGIRSVAFYLDGTHLFSDTTPPYTFFWGKTQSIFKSHTLKIIAYDNAWNRYIKEIEVLKIF